VQNGKTIIRLENETGELKIFGDHNLLNLHAAWYVCKELGIDPKTFVKAIGKFTGASKRLELLAFNESTNIYRDFAHAPSKVKATINAVKQQFPDRKLIAVLELHTYSSLNEKFMVQYKDVMNNADVAAIFYSSHALGLKRMPELSKEKVIEGFNKKELSVINKKEELTSWLEQQFYKNANLLLMSSGDYDGTDMITFAKRIVQ
jgi:UDP-N-acetylmuramate: L-alanyl-gamma-D-glutamyl-meso-diaminopimelate ligase